ncbi:hypothetical protein UlMin_033680 [Ulmus minor]
MAEVVEPLLPYRIVEKEDASSQSSNPTDAVLFVGLSLVMGIACRHIFRGTRVPYTVALLLLGIALGSIEYGTHHQLGKLGDGIRLWANIDPNLLLAAFLPPLLFESTFSMEIHQIKKCIAQMIILAGPGVLISTFCLGSALKLTFPYDWSWKTSLLLGGLLSATDPVAVIALLKELGTSKKLSTIIEGESLMNDGIAIVIYQLFYQMVMGRSFHWATILKFLAQVSLGAVGIGLAYGIVSVLWLRFIFNDSVIDITLTLAMSYVAYFTAQEGADVSGILTVMTLGMFYAAAARTVFKGDGQQSLHHSWEIVAYVANTLIFILSGVLMAEGVLEADDILRNGNSWAYLVLLYVYVQVTRLIVVGVLYPLLRYFGYGLDWKEATMLIWSGLRGAVSLSLSLSFKRSSGSSSLLSPETGTLFVFFTAGIVFLTLIVNGSTAQFILHLLDMDKPSAAKRRILDYTEYEILNEALKAFGHLREDELGLADWPTVKRYIASLNNVEGECVHPHNASESDKNLDPMNLKDVLHVVKTRQVTYSVLNHISNYIQNLEKVGVLEETEMLHLYDAVQIDLKSLQRNPPLINIPKIKDIIIVHPLMRALPSSVREPLEGSTKELMKLRGLTLYKEGSKPNGIWLISDGVLKQTSMSIKNKQSLHPTFTHGSTLGLYEVITGKPYICDMITDSAVLCFFVETDNILSALRSDSSLEEFLWQESAIVLLKLFVPQIFEKMTMQDLRVLVAERSITSIYMTGKTIEIPHHSIGFLLEGFIKTQGTQELITSPAALLPLHGYQSFQKQEIIGAEEASFSHQGSSYLVETSARIMICDIMTLESDRESQRSSSSVPHSIDDFHRSLPGEHSGLMSWPEHFHKPRQHKQNSDAIEKQPKSLSARAMPLSIYGSMVNLRRQFRSFRGSHSIEPTDRTSSQNISSHPGHPLDRKKSGGTKFTGQLLLQSAAPKDNKEAEEDISNESVAEDEIIVRIDSPSRLSFRQAS